MREFTGFGARTVAMTELPRQNPSVHRARVACLDLVSGPFQSPGFLPRASLTSPAMGKSALPIHTAETGATKDPFPNSASESLALLLAINHRMVTRINRKRLDRMHYLADCACCRQ